MTATKSLLLDTHIWIWLANGDPLLSPSSRQLINKAAYEQKIFVSVISVWEIAMLQMKNKIKLEQSISSWIKQALAPPEITLLPLSPEIAVESCNLPRTFQGDPADRILVASARLEKLTLITRDEKLIAYGAEKIANIWAA